MEMNTASLPNPIDHNASGLIGRPIDRVDGRLKVTGAATYAHEYHSTRPVAHGFIVEAGIGKGRIVRIDTRRAAAVPGVLLVMTHENAPRQAAFEPDKASPQLASADIAHHGQAVALVVAESLEVARHAAGLVDVDCEASEGRYELAPRLSTGRPPQPLVMPPDSRVGDFDAAFAAAAVTLDATYTTPHHVHIQMEPHASLAEWDGDRLTLYTANQMLLEARTNVAKTLCIDEAKVRLVSRHVGGGFGSKLDVLADAVLAALAARELGRPVKIALTRQQVFHLAGHRSETVQRVRLGADAGGRLLAIGHEVWCENGPGMTFYEPAADQTRALYAAANRLSTHRLVELDLPMSASMRAPGEAVGLLALECAMDELAEKLQLDPIELRRLNEPSEDPEKRIPFSSRKLVDCIEEGARRFGWQRRDPRPGQVVEGRWQIGLGMASAIRGNYLMASKAKLRLDGDGLLTVRTAMTDIGTGSYTVLTQIAAEMLGLPVERVKVELGDTDFPPAAGSGGSWGASSSGSSVYQACDQLRTLLARKAGLNPAGAVFAGGRITGQGRAFELAALAGPEGLEAEGEIRPGETQKKFSQYAYGAHFAEVGVDLDTGEIRLRRMLGVFAAGRILNLKTARSQAIGGMTFGLGAALTEAAVVDRRHGHFVNHDMAEYHVPTHADVPEIDAIYLDEVDDKTNPLKSKGVGELGICGAGAAVANAVYNACGVRIRDYPLTLDKVLAGRARAAS